MFTEEFKDYMKHFEKAFKFSPFKNPKGVLFLYFFKFISVMILLLITYFYTLDNSNNIGDFNVFLKV